MAKGNLLKIEASNSPEFSIRVAGFLFKLAVLMNT